MADITLASDAAHDPAVLVPSSETARFMGVFLAVAPAMFLGSLDQTIVATALPVIAARFDSFANIAWIVSAYLLAATVAAPIYGRLGDAIGRKTALLGALALFIAGSLACALAPSFWALVGARAVQGLGGGGLMTIAQALIGEAVSPKNRGRFQGWFGAVFAAASTLGPVLGGLLSQHVGWRWIFWINLPLGIGAAVVAWRVKAEKGAASFSPDVIGTALFAAATLAVLLALSLGTTLGWGSAVVIGLLATGIFGFAILLPVERRVATPLLSPGLLAQPMVWRACLCVLLYAAALFASLVQFPLLLELRFAIEPSKAGLLLLPLTLAEVGVSTWAGYRIFRDRVAARTVGPGSGSRDDRICDDDDRASARPDRDRGIFHAVRSGARHHHACSPDDRAVGRREGPSRRLHGDPILCPFGRRGRRHRGHCGDPAGSDRPLRPRQRITDPELVGRQWRVRGTTIASPGDRRRLSDRVWRYCADHAYRHASCGKHSASKPR